MNFYAVLSRGSVYYWILFRPITANDYHKKQKINKKKKKNLSSTYFQHLSAKFTFFWFWRQPITRHKTDVHVYGPHCWKHFLGYPENFWNSRNAFWEAL